MGTGKSTLGRLVAHQLGLRFLDSDHEIERRQKRTIPDIFARDGEAAFRAMEKDFIEGGHPATGCVVACGGGLVCQAGMGRLLKGRGVVIGLFASVPTILDRVSRNQNRPLLNVSDREQRIRELLDRRLPYYLDAGVGITTEGRAVREVVNHIIRIYRDEARRFAQKRQGAASD